MIMGATITAPSAITMATASSMSMAEATDRLHLVQWLSPAFPIGAFAYSQGLEWAIAEGGLTSAGALHAWVRAVLHHGSGRVDGILLARARAGDAPQMLADLALAFATSAERETEMLEQGAAFARAHLAMTGIVLPEGLPYAVAVGLATRPLRVTTEEVLTLWLHGLAAQLVSAAVRFVPLGQGTGQRLLHDLAPGLTALATELATTPLDEISGFTPGADLAAMRHETMDIRIFRT
jgi:urease accessory protein